MNILTTIRAAISALNHNAEVNIFEKSRDENETLNYTVPQIVIFPDWSGKTKNPNLQLITSRTYNIDFKTQDEFDNSDADKSKSYDSSTSVDRIQEMEILANSVFKWINSNYNTYNLKNLLEWNLVEPILRENSSTMSGVRMKLIAEFLGEYICNYNL